jgi:transposase
VERRADALEHPERAPGVVCVLEPGDDRVRGPHQLGELPLCQACLRTQVVNLLRDRRVEAHLFERCFLARTASDVPAVEDLYRVPLTIAVLYKNRWQVELFFKWIKQHLRIKHFIATSENAVKAQIWCAVSTYVLIAIVKKELNLDASLYTLLQILSVSVFEKTEISCALQPDVTRNIAAPDSNQLNLLDF